MRNSTWDDEWNNRLEFVEKIIDKNTLDNENIQISTEGGPRTEGSPKMQLQFGSREYTTPFIKIHYQSVRSKQYINKIWSIPVLLLCNLSDVTIVAILKELLDSIRDIFPNSSTEET